MRIPPLPGAHAPIEMERYACGPGRIERAARLLLIAVCLAGICAAIAMVLGYVRYDIGGWPL